MSYPNARVVTVKAAPSGGLDVTVLLQEEPGLFYVEIVDDESLSRDEVVAGVLARARRYRYEWPRIAAVAKTPHGTGPIVAIDRNAKTVTLEVGWRRIEVPWAQATDVAWEAVR